MSVTKDHVDKELMPLSFGLSLIKELIPVPTHVFADDFHYYAKFGFVNEGESESDHGGAKWYQMRIVF